MQAMPIESSEPIYVTRFNMMLLFLNVATKNSENTRSCYDKGDINIYIGIVLLIDRNLCVPFTLCHQDSSSFFYILYQIQVMKVKML